MAKPFGLHELALRAEPRAQRTADRGNPGAAADQVEPAITGWNDYAHTSEERRAIASSGVDLAKPEARKANQALVDQLASIASAKQATPAEIALAWLLAQQPWIVPIPGTTKTHRMTENTGAAAVQLTSDDVRQIGELLAGIAVEGARYPAHLAARAGK